MRVIIRDTSALASLYVANFILSRIATFQQTNSRPFVLGLPTGSSPLAVYQHLVRFHKEGLISFKNVVTFNMDEYVGLPRDHPQSYHTFMHHNFFSHIDIPTSNIHILDGLSKDLDLECATYEKSILSHGGIDLFLGGVGPDGHIAFNEPSSSLTSRTRVKTLAQDTIVANSRFFSGNLAEVPKQALTVGVGTIMDSKEVVIIVTGPAKAIALEKCLEGGVSHMWTLSCLQMHQNALIVADEDATAELKVKTVKYYKQIEEVASSQGIDHATQTSFSRTFSKL